MARRKRSGVERCSLLKNGTKLCVKRGKSGVFIGTLYPRSGGRGSLPVPTGKARTYKTAMSAARRWLREFDMRRGRPWKPKPRR